jgi:hypothetical protein
MADFYLGDGTLASVNYETGLITIEGEEPRPLTDEELAQFPQPRVVQSIEQRLTSALSVLRAIVEDGSVSTEEIQSAVPQVLMALEQFSSYDTWDDKQGLEAVRIIARICHALLIRMQAQGEQVASSLVALNSAVQGLTMNISSLNLRVQDLEESANG